MNKVVSEFLDRVAERLAALAVSLVSSRLSSLHAADQAEQQSKLEDLACAYDRDNKPHIAATLRHRASRLTATDLAGDGLAMIECVTHSVARPTDLATSSSATAPSRLPDFTSVPPKTRKQRTSVLKPHLRLDQPQGQSDVSASKEPQA